MNETDDQNIGTLFLEQSIFKYWAKIDNVSKEELLAWWGEEISKKAKRVFPLEYFWFFWYS